MRECRDLLTLVPVQIIFAILDGLVQLVNNPVCIYISTHLFSLLITDSWTGQDINGKYYVATHKLLLLKRTRLTKSTVLSSAYSI